MFKIMTILISISLSFAVCNPKKGNVADSADIQNAKDQEIKIETYSVETGGYGYDVYVNGALKIHQPHIPGRNGLSGFTRQIQAHQAAQLTADKLSQGIMPPTITEKELDGILGKR
ncbi:DUF4907 domain-containing protein [Leptospira barantonii]|uniref:DUF4907 domain-containing protein n=1 Tax=Leptospira barantonii TaxID=2023184 RepID=UPI001FCB8B89|nr:DUF4907 domain-containing protein [Leptospira barantonii]